MNVIILVENCLKNYFRDLSALLFMNFNEQLLEFLMAFLHIVM